MKISSFRVALSLAAVFAAAFSAKAAVYEVECGRFHFCRTHNAALE